MKKPLEKDTDPLINYLQKQNIEQQQVIKDLTAQIGQLQQRLDKLLQLLYGTKSEKQKKPRVDSVEQNQVVKSQKSEQNAKVKNGRGSLPENLPREIIKHDIPEDKKYCNDCGILCHQVGKVVTEQLDFKPAVFYIKEHRRYKYACRGCQNIFIANMPAQPIDKGLAGPGALTEILINKYQDAMPLYRQQMRFARHGIEISRSTLCDWVTQSAEVLKPIVEKMKSDMLIPGKRIFTDDTPVPVLDKSKNGATHTGRLWTYVGGGQIKPMCAIYEYTTSRSKKAAQKFLSGFNGYLQADAYPGYDELYKAGNIIEVACWAHARRHFADIVKAAKKPSHADDALEYISQLYKIEKNIKNLSPIKRKYYRRRYCKPILKRFYRWLKRRKRTNLPKSPIGKAVNYVLNHWRALNHYMMDGCLEIDNNTAERAIKPLVIGRKNYLFAGSHEGAKRAAIIYSIIETCKLNAINPWDYINNVLTRLPSTLVTDINQLLPYNWVNK